MTLRLPLAACATAIAALCSASATLSAAEWKGYTYTTAAAQASYQSLERIAADVARESKGALTIKINIGGSLPISATSITQAVGDGLLHFAADGFYTGNIPIGGIAFLPVLMLTEEDFAKTIEILEPYIAAAYDQKGVKYLGYYRYPLQTIFAATKITSLKDMEGKKIRTTSSEQAEFVRRLGGTPVTLGTPEVPTSLQRGVIHAVMTASSGGARSYPEMITHNLRFGPNYHLSLFIANKEEFQKLPKDLQDAMVKSAREAGKWATETYNGQEDQFTNEFRSKGVVVTQPTPEEAKQATAVLAPYWDDWAKTRGATAQDALKKIRAALNK